MGRLLSQSRQLSLVVADLPGHVDIDSQKEEGYHGERRSKSKSLLESPPGSLNLGGHEAYPRPVG
jgi:hypothetical protein